MTTGICKPSVLLGGFLACVFVTTGCMTPDKLMGMSVTRGTPDEAKSVEQLVKVAVDKKEDASLRQWAFRSLSDLTRIQATQLSAVGKVIANPGENAGVRSWAAYAMGEWRKKESIPFFVQGLTGKVDKNTGYYILEGMGKVLPAITEDIEINEKVVRSMTAFSAGQTEFTDSMYDFVNEYVSTLTVLVVVLNKTMAEVVTKDPASMRTEIYASVHRVMTAIEAGKNEYLAAYSANEKNLQEAFEASLGAVKVEYQPMYLMLAWYAGKLGNNKELSALCAEQLGSWMKKSDPTLRLVLSWSLARMEIFAKAANDGLTQVLLQAETDRQVLRLMGSLSNEAGKPDELQQILRLQPTAAGAAK
jgi:hypothetical protein